MFTWPLRITEASGHRPQETHRHRGPMLLAMAALTLLNLWLVAWQEVAAQGSARFDD